MESGYTIYFLLKSPFLKQEYRFDTSEMVFPACISSLKMMNAIKYGEIIRNKQSLVYIR